MATAANLRSIELVALRRLDGILQGDYRGLFPGHGSETADARPYTPGDDPRRIDWPVTARAGEPMVRDTTADHELELWLVVDTSSSFAFGTGKAEKAAVARDVAATLGLVADRGGNRVGCVTAGSGVIVPPRSGRRHLAAILGALDRPADGVGDALATAIDSVGRLSRGRGVVVVISDFLGGDDWARALRGASRPPRRDRHRGGGPARAAAARRGLRAARRSRDRSTPLDRHPRPTRPARLRRCGRRPAAPASPRPITGAGAHHLRLRTDRDWVMDLVRFLAQRRHQRSMAGVR